MASHSRGRILKMKVDLYWLCVVSFLISECACFQEPKLPPYTSPEAFPFHALIKGVKTCNGILISKEYIVTPASCVFGAAKVSVFLGFRGYPYFLANHAEPNVQIYTSEHFIVHDDYIKVNEHRYLNNIALVKLPKPAILSSTVHPGKLISKEESLTLSGRMVTITGWILSSNTNLKIVEVPLRSQDTCYFLFGNQFFKNQEMCIKWLDGLHLNLLGNPVSVNGKIIGYQTNTPHCVVHSPTCTRNDLIFNIVPFLDWISRQAHIQITEFTETQNDDSHLKAKIVELYRLVKAVTEKEQVDRDLFNKRLDELANKLEENQKQNNKYALKLDEQIRSTKSEISNNEAKQNASILKLQEEIGGARTEISNGISAQKAESNNLAKRIGDLESKKPSADDLASQINRTFELLHNQTEFRILEIHAVVLQVKKDLELVANRVNSSEQNPKWLRAVEELHNKLSHAAGNVTALIDHRANNLHGELNVLYDKLKEHKMKEHEQFDHLNQAIINVSIKNEHSSEKICSRLDLIEKVVDENRARFDKHIVIENEHTSSILRKQKELELGLKRCCSFTDPDYGDPSVQ